MGNLHKSAILGLILLFACTVAGVALGNPSGPTSGAGLVLEKNLVAGTVLLDGQIELHVTPETRILDAQGKAISLEALPTAPKKGPFVEISSEATVRYEATAKGGKLVANSIRVAGESID